MAEINRKLWKFGAWRVGDAVFRPKSEGDGHSLTTMSVLSISILPTVWASHHSRVFNAIYTRIMNYKYFWPLKDRDGNLTSLISRFTEDHDGHDNNYENSSSCCNLGFSIQSLFCKPSVMNADTCWRDRHWKYEMSFHTSWFGCCHCYCQRDFTSVLSTEFGGELNRYNYFKFEDRQLVTPLKFESWVTDQSFELGDPQNLRIALVYRIILFSHMRLHYFWFGKNTE